MEMINQNTPLSILRLFSPMEGELREADDTGIVGDNTIALTAYETVDYTRYVKKSGICLWLRTGWCLPFKMKPSGEGLPACSQRWRHMEGGCGESLKSEQLAALPPEK